MKMIKLIVKTKTHNYPIVIGPNLVSKFSSIINQEKILVIKKLNFIICSMQFMAS